MSYVLREQVENRYYHKDGKIIEFDTIEEAKSFISGFLNFSMSMAMSRMNTDGFELIPEIQEVCNSTIIEDKPIECECGFINYKDLER